jgi:cell division protein FtsQ
MSEEQQRNGEKHSRSVYATFSTVALIVLVAWLGFLQWREHLSLVNIAVEGYQILTPEEIVKLAAIPAHSKLYEIDLTIVEKNVKRSSFVKRLLVKREAPATLRIAVEEREPVAVLVDADRKTVWNIDDEGVILPAIQSSAVYDLPAITGLDTMTFAAGERMMRNDLLEALRIIRISHLVSDEVYHLVSEVRVDGEHDIVLFSADAGVPIIFGHDRVEEKLVMLDAFYQRFLKETGFQLVRYIDLRYEDQIVVSNGGVQSS